MKKEYASWGRINKADTAKQVVDNSKGSSGDDKKDFKKTMDSLDKEVRKNK